MLQENPLLSISIGMFDPPGMVFLVKTAPPPPLDSRLGGIGGGAPTGPPGKGVDAAAAATDAGVVLADWAEVAVDVDDEMELISEAALGS